MIKKIGQVFIYIFVNLILFEFVLSFFDPESVIVKGFDKKLLFSMYPNKKGRVVSNEYNVLVETNEFGFRQKLNQTYDVLVVGDSFTEGWGVEEDEIFTTVLNKESKQKYRNLGLHGSSPVLYALQIPFYLDQFKPKKLIVQLFDNDLDDNEKISNFLEFKQNGEVEKPKQRLFANLVGESVYNFLKESTLYRLFAKIAKKILSIESPILYYKDGKEPKSKIFTHDESIKQYGPLQPLGEMIDKKYNGQFKFYSELSSRLWNERFFNNEIYLKQIVQEAKKRNVEISFLYIPAKEYFAKGGILGDCKDCTEDDLAKKNPHLELIELICKKEGLNCFFGNKIFFNKDPESLYFPYDAHLNRKGHKVLAEFLLNQ
ncbi:MAG: SGNH/GDSL hydrolase family protein [Leptospiraceae bacterium]|nr:SGNH/GDSL hydrolase family protein [Leptospiraceae bacterium]